MKNGKYSNKKGLNMKPLALLLALALVVGGVVGGTIAWLTAETEDVTNTFTVGDIAITLVETGTDANRDKGYHFVPGDTLAKDPKVTVTANSEDCYLFVKVTCTNNTFGDNKSIVNWEIRDKDTSNPANPENGWVAYTPTPAPAAGVTYYYRTVDKSTADQSFYLLTGGDTGQVTISHEITKDMVAIINNAKPTLKFDAAAVQTANITDVNTAFAQIVWAD